MKREEEDNQPQDAAEDLRDESAPVEETDDLQRLLQERDQYIELARRARADYVNLQRRTDMQASAVRKEAEQRFALDMIAVLDDLERAMEHADAADNTKAVLEGVALVRDNFLAALARYGITPISARGEAFDHNLHHAIAEQPTDDVAPGSVVAVAQTGYLADGKLLRPAQVVVARPFDENIQEDD